VLDTPGELATELREGRSPTDADFSKQECCLQMFATLAELESRIAGDLESDLHRAHGDFEMAVDLLERIEAVVQLHPRSGVRSVGAWLDALGELARDLGVAL
jgi:hypothetical protein